MSSCVCVLVVLCRRNRSDSPDLPPSCIIHIHANLIFLVQTHTHTLIPGWNLKKKAALTVDAIIIKTVEMLFVIVAVGDSKTKKKDA